MSWYPWLRSFAEGLVGVVEIGGPLTAPVTALAKALLKLADELGAEENSEKLEEVLQTIQQINELLPSMLENHTALAEDQKQLRELLSVTANLNHQALTAEIRNSHEALAIQMGAFGDSYTP